MTDEAPSSLNERIAQRLRELRGAAGMSLEALATHCGVSRSMISLIERGESSPTAAVLEKLASGLNVPLASFFDASVPADEPLARHAEQPVWEDPHSGYVRRNVSPPATGSPFTIVEVDFPPQARVTYDSPVRETPLQQQVWVLDGVIEVTLGDKHYVLKTGDCLAVTLDAPNSYFNPTKKTTRYAVVLANPPAARR